jgi:hypothetical protein
MIKEKGIKIPISQRDDHSKREKDFEEAFKMEVGDCCIFESVNIRAWKSAFYVKNKENNSLHNIDKQFRFKYKEGNQYRIFRIK